MSEQTWTDEQLQECLDTLDEQIRNGNSIPKVCMYETPARFPWMGMRYILQRDSEVIVLTFPQALQVNAWLQQRATGSPQVQAKHDGKLDDHDEMEVSHAQRYVRLENKFQVMFLDAEQALSLLAWLQQERESLEQLTKEQS